MRDRDFEDGVNEAFESPYCPICTGCGEEGCCSPIHCAGSGGKYCDRYLRDLKFTYELLHSDQSDETWDLLFDKYYKPKDFK